MTACKSRRRLLKTLALSPLLARSVVAASPAPKVAVVGAGAFGGWTALHLQQAGAQVTLVDAWGPGHSRASSGGESRVIRAIYGADRIYSEMTRHAFDLWAQLDAATDHPLYVPTGALWMVRRETEAYVSAALPVMQELGLPVEVLSLAQARGRWPQIDFKGIDRVYLEQRAGVLSARLSCRVIKEQLVAAGGRYLNAMVSPGQIENQRMETVRFNDGRSLAADYFVFALGPWLGKVFPEVIGSALRPTRQEVFYFGAPPGDHYGPERLPVWVDFGQRIYYGLPDTHGRGFKVADDTRGAVIDPTTMDRTPTEVQLRQVRQLLARRFPHMVQAPVVEARVCQYENSPDGHLIADRHPQASNVVLLGGGSGHGFKLSPAVGEMAAAALIADRPLPADFSLARQALANAVTATQFER